MQNTDQSQSPPKTQQPPAPSASRPDESKRSSTSGQIAQPFTAKQFDLSAVEGLSTRALEIHQALYQGYVKQANSLLPLLKSLRSAQQTPEQTLQVDGLVRRYAFERNGMILHELFFECLRGRSGQPQAGVFTETLKEDYGGFAEWQSDVRKLALTRGIGWVLTMQSATDGRFANVWVEEHTVGLLAEHRIVFALDVWEHAYLIDYGPNERMQYVQTIFDNVDWNVVEQRCR